MKWWNRLSLRLTVVMLLVAVVPLAGVAITTIKDIRQLRLKSIAEMHHSVAYGVAERIKSSFSSMTRDIRFLLEVSELESMAVLDQEWYLQMLLKSFPNISGLTILDHTGTERVKVSGNKVFNNLELAQQDNLPIFDKGSKEPVIDTFHRDQFNNILLLLHYPMYRPMDQKLAGVLEVEVNITKLLGFITELVVGTEGYVYVADDQGEIIVHPDQSVVLSTEDGSSLPNPLLSSFVAGEEYLDTNVTYVNRKGQEVFASGRIFNGPDMLIVVAQPVDEAMAMVTRIIRLKMSVLAAVLVAALLASLYFTRRIVKPLRLLERGSLRLGKGEFSHRISVFSADELGSVTRSFNDMAAKLEEGETRAANQNWVKRGVKELDDLLRGEASLDVLGEKIIAFMATYLQQPVGALYMRDAEGGYAFSSGYAFDRGKAFKQNLKLGEGLPGQAARDRKIIEVHDIPEGYLPVSSSLGKADPRHLIIVPFVHDNQVEAVMELGGLEQMSEQQKQFIQETAENIGIMIASVRSRRDLAVALQKTTQQSEELQQQQEELQAANEEMEEQTQMLQASESRLKEQQEELQAANEELEEKTEYLEHHKKSIEEKNRNLEIMGAELGKKASDLAVASKYKSEFLANMSHELRTPLNSLLLLSRLLMDNKDGNLTEDQAESAQIIYNSGNDLLSLINEILDLSRIEAGQMKLENKQIRIVDFVESIKRNFKHLAEKKGLAFKVGVRVGAPETIFSDLQRVEQIIKNFVSNSLKFTSEGEISVEFFQPDETTTFIRPELKSAMTIGVSVRDTGIGIPADKKSIIFEAFQQVEGGTARKYGGTGLGLSISRELARLLGGEIHLESAENAGSTFTLYLPQQAIEPAAVDHVSETQAGVVFVEPLKSAAKPTEQSAGPASGKQKKQKNLVADDREKLDENDKTILIIEDDQKFAAILEKICREKGFKVIVAVTGEEGLECAEEFRPKAIILDIHLPGMDGLSVFETLKEQPSTRHIPVHFMSADDSLPEVYAKGAVGFMTKPIAQEEIEQALVDIERLISKDVKELLLVEDNENQRRAIIKLLADDDVKIHEITSGIEALTALKENQYDCVIVDLGLPDMSGFELLGNMADELEANCPPVIVYTGRDLTEEEERQLRQYSDSIIIKGVRSEERLLDETSLFLHRVVEKMPMEKRKIISALHDTDTVLQGRTILIADDDMRNVYALAKALEERGLKTIKAENGAKALEILAGSDAIDLVLMDIMMPVLDGYETMKQIRSQSRFKKLPIIALTAKAMPQDKTDSIAAGASDYLSKPVDLERLLSMMRVWLFR